MKCRYINIIMFIALCVVGCSNNEPSIYQIISDGIKNEKPTIVFMANPALSNYSSIKRVLDNDSVKTVLSDYNFVELTGESRNHLCYLLCSYALNRMLVIDGDSIKTVFPPFYGPNQFIEYLKDLDNGRLAETLKYVSLLSADSVLVSNVVNTILKAEFYYKNHEINVDEYEDIVSRTINELPYFYNRFLYTQSAKDFDNIAWLDTLTQSEKTIYVEKIHLLKNLMHKVTQNENSILTAIDNTCNLGEVELNQEYTSLFYLHNDSDIPAVVYDITTNCGCIEAKSNRDYLLKGDTMIVRVHFTPQSLGYFRKRIDITTNTEDGYLHLFITGETK